MLSGVAHRDSSHPQMRATQHGPWGFKRGTRQAIHGCNLKAGQHEPASLAFLALESQTLTSGVHPCTRPCPRLQCTQRTWQACQPGHSRPSRCG